MRWWDGQRWTDFTHVVVPAAPPGTGWPTPATSSRSSTIWPWLLALVVGGTVLLGLLVAIAVPTFLGARDNADDRVAWINLERAAASVRPTLTPGFTSDRVVTLPTGLRAANGESRHSYEISASLLSQVAFLAVHSASGHCWGMVLTGNATTTGEVVNGDCTGDSIRTGHFRAQTWG